jgi:GntR family transcriptional regulator
MKLDNTIATPLYKQLEEKLLKEIENGERRQEAEFQQKTN